MQLHQILAQIERLKAEIDALRPLPKDVEERILQKFRLDWNYHSNAIEGNTLTLGETRVFLLHGLTAKGKPFKDHLDIRGHNEAINYMTDFVQQQRPLTQTFIRDLHKILLVEPYQVTAKSPEGLPVKKWIKVSEYKTTPNHVETQTKEIHYYASPEETPARMMDLLDWYRKEEAELHPLVLAATFHYQFVDIHPFDDGNGRMARLLMNLILMRKGYVFIVVKNEDRPKYFAALAKADKGELNDFIEFLGEELIHSMELYLRGAKGEDIDSIGDLDKKIFFLKKKIKYNQKESPIKNKENVLLMQKNFLQPFTILLIRAIRKFRSLFGGIIFQSKRRHGNATTVTPSDIYYDFSEELLMNAYLVHFKTLANWYLIIRMRELQTVKGQEDIDVKIHITFHDKDYSVAYSLEPDKPETVHFLIEHSPYPTFYTPDEIEQFVLTIANQIYKKIVKKLNHV